MLLQEIKTIFHKELDGIYPKEEVDAFFYRCIEHYLGLERFVLVVRPKTTVAKEEEQPLFEALTQLKQERPLQYILGTTHFMDMEFAVNEDVLIPRPETEELVQWIMDDVENQKSEIEHRTSEIRILDIGTGTGCIAISLAKNIPNAKVYALDISERALNVAKKNAKANTVEIIFLKHSILNFELELELEFDIIVSNPPYVRELEKKEIKKNVVDHEPHLALFVSDEDPLLFYRAIAHFANRNLSKNGGLYLEINQYLGAESQSLLKAHNFSEIELRKDIFGNDRMIKANPNP
ncbi:MULTISPECIES: peptide chain release factor N(5)-glutamine methyltransferase [Flavobacteriaceae]|uniref:peptide chain release factor N(5)-glutamine methyltransferase n=1 Tax=Flavobacteriaceae TaxID=49546 RepID=UPI00234AED9C|nr:peptide chain release factor N(5)-glutamine methyltransferase [Muricauda sp. SP22]MDC6363097.1 peptide chain release factor N(5)-glutamine methyltransferase [Muricauda sp. SP22]